MSLPQIQQFMTNVWNFTNQFVEENPDAPIAQGLMNVIVSEHFFPWQEFMDDPNVPFDYATVLEMLGLPNPFARPTLPVRRRGEGIGSSKSKGKKKLPPFDYSVPTEFPKIKDKLISLYKFYQYDTNLGDKKLQDRFTSDDIKALEKFYKNPTIDNLGTMPLSYKDYIVKYNTYIKDLNEKQFQKDLDRWRKRMK